MRRYPITTYGLPEGTPTLAETLAAQDEPEKVELEACYGEACVRAKVPSTDNTLLVIGLLFGGLLGAGVGYAIGSASRT